MRRIHERIIPNSCRSVMVLFITICLWWIGCGSKADKQKSDWADLNRQVETQYAQGHYERAIPLAEKALSVAKAQYGPDHPYVATVWITSGSYIDTRAGMPVLSPSWFKEKKKSDTHIFNHGGGN